MSKQKDHTPRVSRPDVVLLPSPAAVRAIRPEIVELLEMLTAPTSMPVSDEKMELTMALRRVLRLCDCPCKVARRAKEMGDGSYVWIKGAGKEGVNDK